MKNKSSIIRFVIFLVINFAALGIGSLFTTSGASSDWYFNLDKAPWTPPGWIFGLAWTTLMIFFSVYMAYLWQSTKNNKNLIGLFVAQWILNVSWNPIFFKYHLVMAGLIIIVSLTFLVGYFLFKYYAELKIKSVFILPYFLWLIIATSLNLYICLMN